MAVGDSVSLRWENTTSLTVVNQHLRVDGACATPCGPDDVYRIRAFETTYSIPRFNNAGSQVTVLLLQNPTAYTGHRPRLVLERVGDAAGQPRLHPGRAGRPWS